MTKLAGKVIVTSGGTQGVGEAVALQAAMSGAAGVVITDLPYGYVELYHGGGYYYFHDGYFYRPHRRGYIRVSPPRGAIIPRLPSRARRYRRGRTEYKEYRGVRYERIRDGRNRGYRVRGKAQNRRHRRR